MEKEPQEAKTVRRQRQAAREQLVTTMLEGHTFWQVSANTPTLLKRAMAYRLLHAVRTKYELDNHKDQVMTICKVALANLSMWVRDHYFSAQYARAGWNRLQVFFQLPGRIFWGKDRVEVELKRFNDRALNRDLEMLCTKVAQQQPRLPDGRSLLFRMQGTAILLLDAQEKAVA